MSIEIYSKNIDLPYILRSTIHHVLYFNLAEIMLTTFLFFFIFKLVNPSNTNEEAIAETIKTRLSGIPGIPFINIIEEAFKLKKFIVVRRVRLKKNKSNFNNY